MNKKLIICVFILLMTITFVGCKKEEPKEDTPPVVKSTPLMEMDQYKDLNIDDVVSLDTIKYTEGGDNRETTTDKEEILARYNNLKNVTIGEETDRACEDNTTVYTFHTKDGNKYTFEFECSWLVVGNKRYNIVK